MLFTRASRSLVPWVGVTPEQPAPVEVVFRSLLGEWQLIATRHGSIARSVASVFAVTLVVGCAPYVCGWDDALSRSDNYRVTLVEPYRAGLTTTAMYSMTEDLRIEPAPPSCAGFDEVVTGAVFDVSRLATSHPTTDDCSMWDMTVRSPTISSTGPAIDHLNVRPNLLRTGVLRDFGGGCVGTWELTFHAPGNDPFVAQSAAALPVVLAYRVFKAPIGAPVGACAALLGIPPPTSGALICGDTFVATMTAM